MGEKSHLIFIRFKVKFIHVNTLFPFAKERAGKAGDLSVSGFRLQLLYLSIKFLGWR